MIQHRDGSRQLIIYLPTAADNAKYECVATNSVKTVRVSRQVDITAQLDRYEKAHHSAEIVPSSVDAADGGGFKQKLMFETFLKNVTVQEGRPVKFICSVKGSVSDRQVRWLHDGQLLDFSNPATAQAGYTSVFSGGLIILEIARVQVSHAGEFVCVVAKGTAEIATTSKLFVYAGSVLDDVRHVPPAFSRSLTGWARLF